MAYSKLPPCATIVAGPVWQSKSARRRARTRRTAVLQSQKHTATLFQLLDEQSRMENDSSLILGTTNDAMNPQDAHYHIKAPPGLHLPYNLPAAVCYDASFGKSWGNYHNSDTVTTDVLDYLCNTGATHYNNEGFAVFSSSAFDKQDDAGPAEATGASKNAEVEDGFTDFPSSAFDKQDRARTTCTSEATTETEDADDEIAAFSNGAFGKKDDPGNTIATGTTKNAKDNSDDGFTDCNSNDEIAAFSSSAFAKKDGLGPTVATKTNKNGTDDSKGLAVCSSSAFNKKDDTGSADASGTTKNAEVDDGFTDFQSSAFDEQDHAGTTCAYEITKETGDNKQDDAGSAEATGASRNAEVDDGLAVSPSCALDRTDLAGTTCTSEATKETEAADGAITSLPSSAFKKKDDPGNVVGTGATKITRDDKPQIQLTAKTVQAPMQKQIHSPASQGDNTQITTKCLCCHGTVSLHYRLCLHCCLYDTRTAPREGTELNTSDSDHGSAKTLDETDSEELAVLPNGAFDKIEDAGSAEAAGATEHTDVADGFADFSSSTFDKHDHAGTMWASSTYEKDSSENADGSDNKSQVRKQISSKNKSEDKHRVVSFLELAARRQKENAVAEKDIDEASEQESVDFALDEEIEVQSALTEELQDDALIQIVTRWGEQVTLLEALQDDGSQIKHQFICVDDIEDSLDWIVETVFRPYGFMLSPNVRCLIIVEESADARTAKDFCQKLKISAGVIDGFMDLATRKKILELFKLSFEKACFKVLIVTEVALAHLQVPDVEVVVNMQTPLTLQEYMQRLLRMEALHMDKVLNFCNAETSFSVKKMMREMRTLDIDVRI